MINRYDLTAIARQQKQRWQRRRLYGPSFRRQDAQLKATFTDPYRNAADKIDHLTDYFWQAQQQHLCTSGTIAYYPGHGSIYGARNDGIEGVTRLLPLWVAYRHAPHTTGERRRAIDTHVRRALLNGTDPSHSGYWGNIGQRSTLICEAGDIALALWLAKDSLWATLNDSARKQIFSWLKQVIGKQTADNNWHLFVILTDKVLEALDPQHRFASGERYQRIKSFYRGNGCFADGEAGVVDLYNAWAFHYALFWIAKVDPGFDSDFIHDALFKFCTWYQYLFTSRGVVLFGRSLCYRMAAPAPLLMASELDPGSYPPGSMLNALVSCWQFFIEQGGVCQGRPSQGVFEDDITWLDPYSGPASAFWATRSLVVYYHQYQARDWSGIKLEPLPAQCRAMNITVAEAELRLTTDPARELSRVIFYRQHTPPSAVVIKSQTAKQRLQQLLYGVAHRPVNNLLKQGLREFDSRLDIYRR